MLAHSKAKLLATGIIEAGQWFGEEEIFLKTPRKMSVVCQSNDNQVVKIPAEQFVLVISQYPKKVTDLAKSVAIKKEWKVAFEGKLEHTISNYRKMISEIGKQDEEREIRLPSLSTSKKTANNSETHRLLLAASQTEKMPTSMSNARTVTSNHREKSQQDMIQLPTEGEHFAFGLTEVASPRQHSHLEG